MPARKVSLNETVKKQKPSLSSLMPEKSAKATAARNSAVKRIAATSSRTAKKVAENAARGTKKSAAKSAPKTPRKTAVRAKKVTVLKREFQALPTRAQMDEILLPSRVSVRAQEKVLAILQTVSKDFEHASRQVAYASGFCFIILGSYLALSFSNILPTFVAPQAAQLINSTTSGTVGTVTTTTAPKPTFTLLEPLPPVISEPSKHNISVANAEVAGIIAVSSDTGDERTIPYEKLVEGTYRLTLDPERLEAEKYVLYVYLRSLHDDSKYKFTVGTFAVSKPLLNQTTTTTDTTNTTDSVTGTQETTTTEDSSTTESSAGTEEDVVVEEPEVEEVLPVIPEDKLELKTLGSILTAKTVLNVNAPSATRFVEIYIRPLMSANMRFVGLAEKRDGKWQYFFNTVNTPNGEYELIARTKIDNNFIESGTVKVRILNYVAVPTAPATAIEDTEEEAEIDEPEAAESESIFAPTESNTSLRTFSDTGLSGVSGAVENSTVATTSDLSFKIDDVMQTHEETITDLFERYAVARQSGDPIMLKLVEEELEKARQGILRDMLTNEDINGLGDNISTALTDRFFDVQRRIDTFEELRKSATDKSSSVDNDGDGISNFDEEVLYKTDPDNPDTDKDGVTDGIEIMRGYNPNNESAEAVIAYEMPQDTISAIESDTLSVDGVSPLIKTVDPTIAPTVQAEIRGKALPNSYVTLYIFSTPTIVTVRTDDDGSFVYTFEKELEDGEHEVYVAVTDNTGNIVAKSSPFKFVKEAEAFSPVGGSLSGPANEFSTGSFQAFGVYNIAIGLGVLALGMILLMLGATLKKEEDLVVMTTPSNDIKVA